MDTPVGSNVTLYPRTQTLPNIAPSTSESKRLTNENKPKSMENTMNNIANTNPVTTDVVPHRGCTAKSFSPLSKRLFARVRPVAPNTDHLHPVWWTHWVTHAWKLQGHKLFQYVNGCVFQSVVLSHLWVSQQVKQLNRSVYECHYGNT